MEQSKELEATQTEKPEVTEPESTDDGQSELTGSVAPAQTEDILTMQPEEVMTTPDDGHEGTPNDPSALMDVEPVATAEDSAPSPPAPQTAEDKGEQEPHEKEKEPREKELTFLDHLEELRQRILRSIVYVLIGAVAAWYLYGDTVPPESMHPRFIRSLKVGDMVRVRGEEKMARVVNIKRSRRTITVRLANGRERQVRPSAIKAPWGGRGIIGIVINPIVPACYEKDIIPITFESIIQPLILRLQICAVAGLVLAFPLVLYEIIAFIWPALYPHEKRFALMLLPFSILLFVGGILMSYYFLGIMARFMMMFLPTGMQLLNFGRIYVWMLVKISALMGLVFQLPLVLMFLGKLEVVTARGLLSKWRHAVVIIFTIAAIITPTIDPVNMSIVAAPVILLYFLSIILVWWVQKKQPVQ